MGLSASWRKAWPGGGRGPLEKESVFCPPPACWHYSRQRGQGKDGTVTEPREGGEAVEDEVCEVAEGQNRLALVS